MKTLRECFPDADVRSLGRLDYQAACKLQGLDPDAFEAAAQSDVLSGYLELPRAAQLVDHDPPPAYWDWLISLLNF